MIYICPTHCSPLHATMTTRCSWILHLSLVTPLDLCVHFIARFSSSACLLSHYSAMVLYLLDIKGNSCPNFLFDNTDTDAFSMSFLSGIMTCQFSGAYFTEIPINSKLRFSIVDQSESAVGQMGIQNLGFSLISPPHLLYMMSQMSLHMVFFSLLM